MRKIWRDLAACLLAFTMVFGNSAFVVNAEEIRDDGENVTVMEQKTPSEETIISVLDEMEEAGNPEEEEKRSEDTLKNEDIQKHKAVEHEVEAQENIIPMTAEDQEKIDSDVEDSVFLYIESDSSSPYWAEKTYFGQKQTLTANVGLSDGASDELKEKIKGATFEWTLGRTDCEGEEDNKADPNVLSIQANGNKCTVVSNRKEGYAWIKTSLKKGGEEICSEATRINVYENVVSYELTAKELYVHPGDRISVNDFEPQLKKYINDKLSGTIKPIKYTFYLDVEEEENYLSFNSDMTMFTVNNIPEATEIWGYPIQIEAEISELEGIDCSPVLVLHHLEWDDWETVSTATVFAPEKQVRKCQRCEKREERTVGSRLKATIKFNMSSIALLTKQSTKDLKVAFAEGDSVASWRSSDTKIVTVSGNADGTCTIKAGEKTGTAKITVKTAAGAEKTINVNVQKATVKFNSSSVTLKTKQSTKNLKAAVKKGDSVVSWKSSNTKIVAVSGKSNGTCTIKAGKKIGTAKITVKTAAGAEKTIKVTVQKGKVTTSSIKQVPKKVTVKKGQTYKLTPSIQPITSTDKIKYSSADKKIATVSGKGVIKGKKAGKTKITVTAGKKRAVCTVIVKK